MTDIKGIQRGLSENLISITELIRSCSAEELNRPKDGKWSIAEQAVHLNKSVSPINLAMGLPRLTFYIFGKVSFSRSYDEVVNIYKSSLNSGAKASKAYIPSEGVVYDKDKLLRDLDSAYHRYIAILDSWSEPDLDTYRLPHPILGKLTMREMAYFTKYHMEHHLNSMIDLRG